jgi:hypothetical protein
MFIYLDWCYGAIRWWGFANRVVWFLDGFSDGWVNRLVFGAKAYPSAHDPQWTLNTHRSTLFPFTISIQNDCYIIKPWPHETKGWNMVPSLKTCRIVSLNRRFLPVLCWVGWFFEFLKNHWYWFFEHLRMKKSLVSLLWNKKTESKNPLVLVISKTSKNSWFSWRNRQRTSFESHNHIPKPIILKEIGNWRASGYIHCLIYTDGYLSSIPRASKHWFLQKFHD